MEAHHLPAIAERTALPAASVRETSGASGAWTGLFASMHAPSFRGRARRRETAGRAVDSRSVGETTRRHPMGASSRRAPAREMRKRQRSDNPPRTGNRQVSYGDYETSATARRRCYSTAALMHVAPSPFGARGNRLVRRPDTPLHRRSPHPPGELGRARPESTCDRAKTLLFRPRLHRCPLASQGSGRATEHTALALFSTDGRSELGRDVVGTELYRAPCFQTITCEEATVKLSPSV
jgi:hypothetical protein